MKNIFFICMFGLLAFAGCSDNEEEILTGGNIEEFYKLKYCSTVVYMVPRA